MFFMTKDLSAKHSWTHRSSLSIGLLFKALEGRRQGRASRTGRTKGWLSAFSC